MRDLAIIVFDLVHYGGFSYADVLSMPIFERKFMHERIAETVKNDIDLQLALHDKKAK